MSAKARVILALGGLVAVLSEPPGELEAFVGYYVLIALLLWVSKVSLRFLVVRWGGVVPILTLASLLILISSSAPPTVAFSVLLRGLAAVALVAFLMAPGDAGEVLRALSGLGAPKFLVMQSALMLRFAHILEDEAVRTGRARRSRTPGALRVNRVRTLGQQAGLVFLRGWRRARTMYQAMLARGFAGTFPASRAGPLSVQERVAVVLGLAAFLTIRLL